MTEKFRRGFFVNDTEATIRSVSHVLFSLRIDDKEIRSALLGSDPCMFVYALYVLI